ncbi:hypothetical protein [Nocardiopsis dassonvillei]|uniref:hypothetical protein n=1 Tax=Nocardiopsis dassonvillei TaxID=2014 RepID=UPI0036701551
MRPQGNGLPALAAGRPTWPGRVIAQALEFHSKTTTRVVVEAGGIWNRYAPSDHSQ